MVNGLLSHPLSFVMLALAIYAYMQVFIIWFVPKEAVDEAIKIHNIDSNDYLAAKTRVAKVVIASLPLIGLLGTVMGMQQSFSGLVYESVDGYQVAAGISNAMLTTLVGLSLAIVGWLLTWAVSSHFLRININ